MFLQPGKRLFAARDKQNGILVPLNIVKPARKGPSHSRSGSAVTNARLPSQHTCPLAALGFGMVHADRQHMTVRDTVDFCCCVSGSMPAQPAGFL